MIFYTALDSMLHFWWAITVVFNSQYNLMQVLKLQLWTFLPGLDLPMLISKPYCKAMHLTIFTEFSTCTVSQV